MPDLTGICVEEALEIMKEYGIEGQVYITTAPGHIDSKRQEKGETRVICVRGNTVIAARFLVYPQID